MLISRCEDLRIADLFDIVAISPILISGGATLPATASSVALHGIARTGNALHRRKILQLESQPCGGL